jgi:hypothetical protein
MIPDQGEPAADGNAPVMKMTETLMFMKGKMNKAQLSSLGPSLMSVMTTLPFAFMLLRLHSSATPLTQSLRPDTVS